MASRIRELRELRMRDYPTLFTARALSARIGVTESAYLRWEAGTARPRARHAATLAKELGVEVFELGLDEEPSADPGADQQGH
jgi:transcriptional regulator with XRE-family HTH domain